MAKPKTKTAAIYARVSTRNGQTPENQIRELRRVAERNGWEIVGEYVDYGISGAKGRDQRPEFDRLLKDATRREFDIVMAWSVDRLGRSLQHLVVFLSDIHAKGIDLYLHQQGLDTTTPTGRMMFQMCGMFAEFEREMIRERINAGIVRSRETGTKSGRPHGRPKSVTPEMEAAIHSAREDGVSLRKIAQQVGTSLRTVQRVLEAQAA